MTGNNSIHINGIAVDLNKPLTTQIDAAAPNYVDKLKLIRFLDEWRSESDVINQQTSGSTGAPKKIALKKKAMLTSAELTCNHFRLNNESTLLLCLDIDFIAGKMMVIRTIMCGGNLLLRPADKLYRHYPTEQISFVAMVPIQLESLIYKKVYLNNTVTILLGGAPVSEEQCKHFSILNSDVWQSYAMTETCSHVALRPIKGNNPNNEYKALPGITFTTSSNDSLIISAPTLLEAPLATNDIVELINDTSFLWIGRSDFMINSGGIKVSPEKVEKLISKYITIPYYIGSKKTADFGEEICLVLQRETPLPETEEKTLLSALKSALPKYHAPKSICYLKELTKTESGKLKREKF